VVVVVEIIPGLILQLFLSAAQAVPAAAARRLLEQLPQVVPQRHPRFKATLVVQDLPVPQWLVVAAAAQVQQVARLVVAQAVTEVLVLLRLLLGVLQPAQVRT
jgi:hypothetical protein